MIWEAEQRVELSRTPKTSDCYGRYYTDSAIANLLVEAMSLRSPRLVIDLSAGNGALVGEAYEYWKGSEFVTVDIDQTAASAAFRSLRGSSFTHHTADALDSALDEKIGLRYGGVDSALCNPPYIRPKWRKQFGEILEDAGLSHVIPKLGCIQADVLFIAQNLRFLRTGGKLGLILPDGVVAGERYAKLRQSLATIHRLERVIELPRRVFRNTEAKAHIVVLAKYRFSGDDIQVQRLRNDGSLSPAIRVSPDRAATRLDYSYLTSQERTHPRTAQVTLRSITRSVTRGSHSSSQRHALAFPVFHTTDFKDGSATIPGRFHLKKKEKALSADSVVARTGDILIARVGRSLSEKVSVVKRGSVAVSDCIFVVRVDPIYQEKVLKFLRSKEGRTALLAASHGVGASFITIDALLNLTI